MKARQTIDKMPFPELHTERLKLRRLQLTDLPLLVQYANNKKISDQIINIPFPYTEDDAVQRLNFVIQGFAAGERYVFVITKDHENQLIGEIGLHLDKHNNIAQFGYWIAEPFWGQGIASEALTAVLQFGLETLQLQKIYATHYTDNPASGKVMLHNHMIKEAELKDHYRIDGAYKSVAQYRLTIDEYKTLKQS